MAGLQFSLEDVQDLVNRMRRVARNAILHGWATTWHGRRYDCVAIARRGNLAKSSFWGQGLGRWPSLSQRQATQFESDLVTQTSAWKFQIAGKEALMRRLATGAVAGLVRLQVE
jgi:hypothetical protein